MDLIKILEDFARSKEQIRQKTKFRVPTIDRYNGLSMAISYSNIMEYVVNSLFDLTFEQINQKREGIAAFLYGSPGRREMVCESDLDTLLIYKDNSSNYKEFKNKFKELTQPFQFCKIDLPEWGTLEEARIFAQRSITEGNQVLECRYICGDEEVAREVKEIQKQFGNPERMTKNIVFQRFYFEQYFKQRIRDGAINVKYCNGGSRDYLFIHWFNQLMVRKYPDWGQMNVDRPVAETGIINLYKNGLIDSLEFGRSIEALHFNLLLRNEILLINKKTKDEGLTFLDDKTLKNVFDSMPELMKEYNIKIPNELKDVFDKQRFHIAGIKDRIWNLVIEEQGKELGNKNWANDFRKAYALETPEDERQKFLDDKNILIKIALIQGASDSGQKNLLNEITNRERHSNSWEIQASLTTSPYCSPEYLHWVGTGIGKDKGYGYLLRIVSRNPNVKQETLESIAYDEKVEQRYKQCAKAALEHGKNAVNHQV